MSGSSGSSKRNKAFCIDKNCLKEKIELVQMANTIPEDYYKPDTIIFNRSMNSERNTQSALPQQNLITCGESGMKKMGREREKVTCPCCRAKVTTEVEFRFGCCALFCFYLAILCSRVSRDVYHYCPKCNYLIGVNKFCDL